MESMDLKIVIVSIFFVWLIPVKLLNLYLLVEVWTMLFIFGRLTLTSILIYIERLYVR